MKASCAGHGITGEVPRVVRSFLVPYPCLTPRVAGGWSGSRSEGAPLQDQARAVALAVSRLNRRPMA
jgi:hypothetical protein